MTIYIILAVIILSISILGFIFNKAETNYILRKSKRMIKRNKKRRQKRRQKIY